MVYSDLVKKAMNIAYNAHHGQYDKGGLPYILHPIYVAEQMESEIEVCAALLHDVCEDGDVIYINQIYENFSSELIDILRLLTHRKNESYIDYINRLKNSNNEHAINVKLADLKHNRDLSRLSEVSEKDLQRQAKYDKAIEILNR